MRNMGNLGVIAAAIALFAPPLSAQAQGTTGGAVRGAVERSHAAAPRGAAGLLSADQRVRFREYAVKEHRATPYSFREPVTVGTVLPPVGIELYEIPRQFGVPPEYRYAVVNNLVIIVDPVTHQIVEVVE
jgi:Protein of unknown function (DUF1236)